MDMIRRVLHFDTKRKPPGIGAYMKASLGLTCNTSIGAFLKGPTWIPHKGPPKSTFWPHMGLHLTTHRGLCVDPIDAYTLQPPHGPAWMGLLANMENSRLYRFLIERVSKRTSKVQVNKVSFIAIILYVIVIHVKLWQTLSMIHPFINRNQKQRIISVMFVFYGFVELAIHTMCRL